MARSLSAGLTAEVTAASLTPIFLVKFAFASGDVNFWTGVGPLVFNGDTYTGAGDLGTVSPVQETQEMRAPGLKFSLSGISSSLISITLTEEYQGRDVTLWLGALDAAKAIVSDPYQIFKGRMDVMEFEDTGDLSTITVSAESILVALERPNERRFTSEDQKLSYPNDRGFEFVTSLQEKEITWGKT